jgi:signal transduction histidine kinase
MRHVIAVTALFAAVLAFCALSFRLFPSDHVVAAVWLPNAFVLAFVLRWSDKLAVRAGAVATAMAAMALASLVLHRPLVNSLVFGLANGAEIAIAAACLSRTPNPLAGPRAFALFVLGAVIAAPIVTGGLISLSRALFEHRPGEFPALRGVFSDALGMLIAGPFALSVRWPVTAGRFDLRGAALAGAGQAAVLAASVVIFMQAEAPPLFLIFPVLVLGTLSHRRLGGVYTVLTVAVAAVICTMLGHGPAVVASLAHRDAVAVMQLFLAATVLTVLPVTALLRKLEASATELDQRRAEAEELSEIKTKLLAHVSHEIRSPLSGVTSLAELMRDGMMGELTQQQRESLAQMAESGAEAEALARDLLDAATLQSGKATVHLMDVDVEDAVETAVTAARFRAKDYGGSVVVVGSYCGTLKVAADRLRLRQILINLIINGLKYGGRPPVVQMAAFATDRGTIRFEVSDNGAGVSPEQRNILFKSFNRLGAEKTDIEGAGLGLALSRELTLLQNGRMGVEDGDLGGACFWLELPLWEERDAAAAA